MRPQYRGFSTIDNNKNYRVIDFELAKRDLINHFSIRKGEKLMNPEFGSNLWAMVHEPLNEMSRQAIIDDVMTVVRYDPRISIENINVIEHIHGFMLELELVYLPNGEREFITLPFLKTIV